jgi:acetyl-CoA carboxylase carboxyltransferase component
VGDDDEKSILACRELIRYLPQNYREKPPDWEQIDDPNREVGSLENIVPDEFDQVYDMHDVIRELVDGGDFFEIKDEYAKQLLCCYARFNGEVVGIAANNPAFPGSIYEVNACDKYYRFLQALDAYRWSIWWTRRPRCRGNRRRPEGCCGTSARSWTCTPRPRSPRSAWSCAKPTRTPAA